MTESTAGTEERPATPVDERSMRILEILVAGMGLAACALLTLVR